MSKPFVVGLTGPTGAGKTTVSDAFASHGYAVINADLVAREVTARKDVTDGLAQLFGEEILREDGSLNRKALGERVFSDSAALKEMDGFLYPLILEELKARMEVLAREGRRYLLLDAPTLFESGAGKLCDKTIGVLAEEPLRRERIMARDGLSSRQAGERIAAQPPDSFYRRRCDYLLYNNKGEDALRSQGEALVKRLEKPESQWKSVLVSCVGFLLFLLVIWGGYRFAVGWQYPLRYEEEVSRYSREYRLEPALVYALIRCESSFRPEAVSSAGAIGLTQITEETFEWVRGKLGEEAANDVYEDLLKPEMAVRYGCRLLSLLLEEFGGEEEALAAYHAGWGQVKRWLSDPALSDDGKVLKEIPSKTTGTYVGRVLSAKRIYENFYRLTAEEGSQ